MDSVASMVDEWLWLDERAIFQNFGKMRMTIGPWSATTQNIIRPSSLRGVAGMVAEWLSLAERLVFQSVSHTISFQIEVELARGVWDSRARKLDFARQRMGTVLLRSTRKRGCLFLKTNVHKSLPGLIWDNAYTFRTVTCL